MSAGSTWRAVTPQDPCPLCTKPDWCARSADRTAIKCERTTEAPAGWMRTKASGNGGIFKRSATKTSKSTAPVNWATEVEWCKNALPPARLQRLAADLGVTPDSLTKLGVGWVDSDRIRAWHANGEGWKGNRPEGAYAFPEHGGDGKVVGVSLRTEDGRKGAPSGKTTGSKRGIVLPVSLATRADPVLIVEGASDVAALETLGLAAVGRPSNTGGTKHLANLLRGREVIVVGERDQKPDGSWPGRDGAERTATQVATAWKRPVPHALPPLGSKDVREWLRSRALDLSDAAACAAAGVELLSAIRSAVESAEPSQDPSQAELLVQLALERYRFGRGEDGEAFAVEHDGPNVALMLNGSRRALKAALAREFRRRHHATPNASALADALTVLEGEAQEADPEPVHLRVAEHEGEVVLDLGRQDGHVVVVGKSGWRHALSSPVLFRRSALTSELPMPESGGTIDLLRELINVSAETWILALAWLVAAFLPNTPHPILMLGGLHGTGKSTAARLLVALVDPSPAPLRSPPSDERNWAVMACASWAMVIDNVSAILAWWSDALCKCVTGDGYPFRKLYTDSELTVLAFRRVVAITSIDAGALRGDLGDRLLLIDLEPIDDAHRRTEKELDACFRAARPQILGALLDIVAGVLRELPNVKLEGMPRLADFACVLAAMDAVLGTESLKAYLGQRERIATDVIDSDAVGQAIVSFMTNSTSWSGTSADLLKAVAPEKPPRGWPQSARALSGRLKRLIPALRMVGIQVVTGERKPGGNRDRVIELQRLGPARDGCDSIRDGCDSGNRPGENGPGSAPEAFRDGRDDRDGRTASVQLDGVELNRNDGSQEIQTLAHWKDASQPSRPSQPSRNGPGESETQVSSGRLRDGRTNRPEVNRPAPPERCHNCRRSRFWCRREGTNWVCGTCNPPSVPDVVWSSDSFAPDHAVQADRREAAAAQSSASDHRAQPSPSLRAVDSAPTKRCNTCGCSGG